MKKYLLFLIALIIGWGLAQAETEVQNASTYRALVLKIRTMENFKIAMPSGGDQHFSYQFIYSDPLWQIPLMSDFQLDPDKKKFYRHFWEKILLQDGSTVQVEGDKVPLTCIYVDGQDNRFAKESPLIPDYILKVYLVANDFTCTGPINPGWPNNGGKKESWDTYVYFEIRDPTIMLPTKAKIRFRSLEFPAIVEAP